MSMRRFLRFFSVFSGLLLLLSLVGPGSLALTRDQRRAIMKSCVLIMPLKLDSAGNVVNIPWRGSGTIIDASGLILTNYHVVEETPDWNAIGILVTVSSDQPPEPAYLAEIVSKDPAVDLAVLRIVSDAKGKAVDVSKLGLVPVEIGNADDLEIGDDLTIFGYPAIGSTTITLTDGKVSGFTSEEGVSYTRAWIKTAASITGGNSGGTAVDADGRLVGVPSRVGETDTRILSDTNGDGVIDQYDTPVSTGGFINQLRPVNLAFDIIDQARV
jgi:S1-C subfamily serine protease